MSLVELGIPADDGRAHAAARTVVAWLGNKEPFRRTRVVKGLARIHASQEGNALAVCCRLGLAARADVRALADTLLETQWPDGGWNCDPDSDGRTSSFYETVTPMWGLAEYANATGDRDARAAADRAAEVLLSRRLFRSRSTGEVVDPAWLKLHYPLYWHYDVLHGLTMLARAGRLRDPRTSDALDHVEGERRRDGTWSAQAAFWRPPGSSGGGVEVVDWGRSGPNEMVTLNALRVLRAAGRLAGASLDPAAPSAQRSR